MTSRAWLALGTVYIVWGSTYLGIALAGETIPPIFAAGVRFLLTGALMGGFVVLRRGRVPFRVGRSELGSAVLVGVLLLGANALLFVAERRVPIGLASLLIASVPLWIVLMRTATGDRPSRSRSSGSRPASPGSRSSCDREATRASAGSCSCSARRRSGRRARSSRRSCRSPRTRSSRRPSRCSRAAPCCCRSASPSRAAESLDPSTWSSRSVVGLVYLVLIGSLVGYTAYVWLLANLPISTVATYAYVNPVVAILLGVIFLNEGVTWQILVGAAVVLASVALVIRSEAEQVVEPFAE